MALKRLELQSMTMTLRSDQSPDRPIQANARWLAAAGLALLVGLAACSGEDPPTQPNIVIIVADDLGWRDVGFHGAEIATPHIDRIAGEGVELARFYAAPVCSPTRVALLTGRYPIRYGLQRVTIKPWTPELGLPTELDVVPEMLGSAGYEWRGIFGKWHLGEGKAHHPLVQGFTHFVGHYGGAIGYFNHLRRGVLDWHHGYDLTEEEGYATDLIGDYAVRFLEESPPDVPYFLYVPFNAVHSPNDVTPEHLERNASLEPEARRIKAAMVTSMDDQIGRILQTIDNRGDQDNTFVLFFSDNGGVPQGGSDNSPLRGRKHSTYEGGIRVAAAARWPIGGIAGGRSVEDPITVLDVYPTLMELAGVENGATHALDGVSVLDLMNGSMQGRDDFEYHSYFNGQNIEGNIQRADSDRIERNAILSGPWKLFREGPNLDHTDDPHEDAVVQLFRIIEDPNEQNDLASDHPDIVEELVARMLEHRALKPDDAIPMALAAPEDWVDPPDWRIDP